MDNTNKTKPVSQYQLENLVKKLDKRYAHQNDAQPEEESTTVTTVDLSQYCVPGTSVFTYSENNVYTYDGDATIQRIFEDEDTSTKYAYFKVQDDDVYIRYTITDDTTYTCSGIYNTATLPSGAVELFEIQGYALTHKLVDDPDDFFYKRNVTCFVTGDGAGAKFAYISGVSYSSDDIEYLNSASKYMVAIDAYGNMAYIYKVSGGKYNIKIIVKKSEDADVFNALSAIVDCAATKYDSSVTYPDGSVGSQLTQLALKTDQAVSDASSAKTLSDVDHLYIDTLKQTIEDASTDEQKIAKNAADIAVITTEAENAAECKTSADSEDIFAITDENGNVLESFQDGDFKTKKFDSSQWRLFDRSVVINNALLQTSASAPLMAFDKTIGIMAVAYMVGLNGKYGESDDLVQLACFSPSQPTNVRWITIESDNKTAEHNVLSLGNGVFRVFYIHRNDSSNAYKYKDYDFTNDSLGEENTVTFNGGDLTCANYKSYLTSQGYTTSSVSYVVIMTSRFVAYDSKLYAVLTTDTTEYPLIVYSEDNGQSWMPLQVIPIQANDEVSIAWYNSKLVALVRTVDYTASIRYTYWDGSAWSDAVTILDSSICRPFITQYKDGLLIGVTIKSEKPDDYFPDLETTNPRRGLKLLYGTDETTDPNTWKTLVNYTSKYGFVYFAWNVIYDDIYMTYSDAPMALRVQNGNTYEQGKENMKFIKLSF